MMISLKRISRVALGALTLGLCAAPSCTPLPIGETMVVLQTDLSLPKDVDRVTIQALVRGDQRHFNEFTKLGQSGQLQIPASIGLTLGDDTDPTTPVTFRVTAYQGVKARVLREVVTTIPQDRLVALKLPIQWLCWDSELQVDGDDRAISNCPENQTCIAGTCADSAVDPATLDDYSPEAVFGGGTGKNNDGTCFDTAACFGGTAEAPVVDAPVEDTGTECFIKPTGDVNVAIRTNTAGICGASGCFVTIDGKSDFGWQAGSDGKLKLPYAVCQRIKDKQASGVSTAAVSSACPLKTDGIPACGPWSSSGKAPPDPAKLGPVTVAANQLKPRSIAVGDGHIYWTLGGSNMIADGVVQKIPILGGSATPLQPAKEAFTRDIALDTDPATGKVKNVIWANSGAGTSMTPPKPGAAVVSLDSKGKRVELTDMSVKAPDGVTPFGVGFLFTDFSGGAVYRADTTGTTLLWTGQTTGQSPYRIVADATRAFWTNETTFDASDGSIGITDVMNPQQTDIISGQGFPRGLAIDSTSAATEVYWANQGGKEGDPYTQKVMMVSLADLKAPKVFADGYEPYGVALDKDTVYWTNFGNGTVMRAPKAGGAKPQVIAAGQSGPTAITVHEGYIYWINEGIKGNLGSVMRVFTQAPTIPEK